MKRYAIVLLIVFAGSMLQSCKLLYPNRMFKEGDYQYMALAEEAVKEYRIGPEDMVTVRIFSQEGIDLISAGQGGQGGAGGLQQGRGGGAFLVRYDGYVDLPFFGNTYVQGLTEEEFRELLTRKASAIFQDPFVIAQVNNRRAFVFKDSRAAVIRLNQGPTTLIEVLALSGGLEQNLKAYKIKLIRGDLHNPQVKNIDLSTMQGLGDGELIVQSNDIIYVERRLRFTRDVLGEFSTIIALLSTVITTITLTQRL